MLFPASGFTTADAVAYYEAVAKVLLPHLKDRPVSFLRFPDTVDGESFWEKDAPGFTPAWVRRVAVPRRGEGEDDIEYVVIDDARTLAWVAEVGGVEIHPFLHAAPRLEVATHVVFDLDPGEGADISDCARVGLLLRDALAGIALQSFAKVSGSKCIQVYVPLHEDVTHEVTEAFARMVADELARRHPKLVVSKMAKELRRGKVLIDWSQNAGYKTTVSVYSLRARGPRPYVSMPVTWEELEAARKLTFTPEEAIARVGERGDLWSTGGTPVGPPPARRPASRPARGRRPLPKATSQSGKRLFVLTDDELRLDMGGVFQRWTIKPCVYLGEMPIDPAWRRGELPGEDIGAYEVVEGSWRTGRFELWFSGRVMTGAWMLERSGEAWRLTRRGSRGGRSGGGSTAGRPRRRAGRR